ncbi:unnamed protein product [Spirodela intermedia]|uniref:Uncharacterized protein n=1 Tax=Spirodela intermedia TaxID=51605 RepID=A0ABN7ED56_SPIIN|nr:unnamed protein product [Spirodela intermedia]
MAPVSRLFSARRTRRSRGSPPGTGGSLRRESWRRDRGSGGGGDGEGGSGEGTFEAVAGEVEVDEEGEVADGG